MNKTREELEVEEASLKAKLAEISAEISHAKMPDKLRDEWRLGFGWPKISQELSLHNKLDKETYDKLYASVDAIINRIAEMVPSYADTTKPCPRCKEIKEIVTRS